MSPGTSSSALISMSWPPRLTWALVRVASDMLSSARADFSKYEKATIAPSTVTKTIEITSILSAMAEFRTAAVVRNPITILNYNKRNGTVMRRDPWLSLLFVPYWRRRIITSVSISPWQGSTHSNSGTADAG